MITYKEALSVLSEQEPVDCEVLSLNEAGNFVVRQDISSEVFVPAFANSAMDGFAVCSDDLRDASVGNKVRLPILGNTVAGDRPSVGQGGGVWEIMTGASVPVGYDSVVKIEDVEVCNDNEVIITDAVGLNANIRQAGEDFMPGDKLVGTGRRLRPLDIMALAAVGCKDVLVSKKPRVVVVSTGKEIVDDADVELLPGQIYNSNGPYLLAQLGQESIPATYGGVVFDDLQDFKDRVTKLCLDNDVIISTGAVSAGKYDFIPSALVDLGAKILFHKVAIRPGKPVLYACFPDGTHYFGLPGNPVSAVVGLRFFVLPLLAVLQGEKLEKPLVVELAGPFKKKSGLEFFCKGYLFVDSSGKLKVEVLKGQESFKISPLLRANCWVVLSSGKDNFVSGDEVEVYALEYDGFALECESAGDVSYEMSSCC